MSDKTKKDVEVEEVKDEVVENKMEVVDHEIIPSYNLPNLKQIEEYEKFLQNYDSFVERMLKDGTDYGVIPGVEKPTLLKPGAEKLEKLFFLRSKKECVLKDVKDDGSFIRYTYRTTVFNKSGQVVATCEGTCNSHEKKYRSQTVFENQATAEQKKSGVLQERTSKNGKPYKVYVIEKDDFYDLENTIMKMAQKRSYVGAILEATNSSSRFTQDVEDMDPAMFGGKTVQNDEKKQIKGVSATMVEKVKASIEKIEDKKTLEDTKGKIEKSDKYTDAQKKDLVKIIDDRIKKVK